METDGALPGDRGRWASADIRPTTDIWSGEGVTWRNLVGPVDDAGTTEAGASALSWALEVHERFFGQSWLDDAERRRDIPFMQLGLWPVTGPGPVMRFVERACLLTLLEPVWPSLRRQGKGEPPSNVLAHLRLVLETAGMAIRVGMAVDIEPTLSSGRRPDLLFSRATGEVAVEVTRQSKDRGMRDVERYGWLVDQYRIVLEREHGVVVEVVSEEVLDTVVIESWFARAANVAAAIATDGLDSHEVREGNNVLIVHPVGTPLTCLHDGPPLSADAWLRIDRRLFSKAEQTKDGPPAWIRIEVDATLFALTNLVHLNVNQRLSALAANVAATLADAPHVLGVLLGPPPSIGPRASFTFAQPVATTSTGLILPHSAAQARALASGPVVLYVPLPGMWGRVTYVLPNPVGQAKAEDALLPGLLLADETSWLDWALGRLGQPSVAEMLD